MQKDNTGYLCLSGAAGGPATYTEIYAFREGKLAERFTALMIAGEIDECGLNGKTISNEEGQAYLNKLPEGEQMQFWGKNTEAEE